MAILGSTAKETASQEWFGLNTTNQVVSALTLPPGGPYRIHRLGVWFAGKDSAPSAALVLISGGGTLLRQSAPFIAASRPFGMGNSDLYERDITDYVVAGGTTVYVGYWRDNAGQAQHGYGTSGSHLHDYSPGAPSDLGAWSSHSPRIGAYLYYELANQAPNAPGINSPTNNEVVSSQNPTVSWTHSDPDGDPQNAWQMQVDDNGDFSSVNWDSGVRAGSASSALIELALTRGTSYAVRVRTQDPSGLWGPWSPGRVFKVASQPFTEVYLPTPDAVARLYYHAGSNTTPKFRVTFGFHCPEGGTLGASTVSIYDAAGTTLLHSQNFSGSATIVEVSGFAPVNGTKYRVSTTVVCSHNVVSPESVKIRCQARWGRASYRADLGSAPQTLSVSSSASANGGWVVLEYDSTAGTTPEPAAWRATIAEVTKRRYVWHRVTLLPQPVANPVSPALNDVIFSFSNNVMTPDHWVIPANASLDPGTYVYGTLSLKMVNDGVLRVATQDISVVPNTDYLLSGRVKTQGDPNASIQLRDAVTGAALATVAAAADTDWTRYSIPWFSGESSIVEVACVTGTGGTVGAVAWFDALKAEASKVVTPWSPGFLGAAVVLDAGGLTIDRAKGGIFRLRGSGNETVELGPRGLELSGFPIGAGTAFPSSPTTGERFFRTDRRLEYVWDGSRWLCTCPHTLSGGRIGNFGALIRAVQWPHPGLVDGWSIYSTRRAWSAHFGTVNATDYWQGRLYGQNGTTATLLGGAPNHQSGLNWRAIVAGDALTISPTSQPVLDIQFHKINAPGNIDDPGAIIEYRFIG